MDLITYLLVKSNNAADGSGSDSLKFIINYDNETADFPVLSPDLTSYLGRKTQPTVIADGVVHDGLYSSIKDLVMISPTVLLVPEPSMNEFYYRYEWDETNREWKWDGGERVDLGVPLQLLNLLSPSEGEGGVVE